MPSDAMEIPSPMAAESFRRHSILFSTGLATLLACAVLLPLLGHKPLTDWDEGIYAEVSREMLSRSWLVPHWNQQPWFEKPPLEMWITAALFRIFGVNEFCARAASALSGVALVAALHGWLAARRDALTAWLSTILLLATFGFLHVCRVGETDVLLSLGCVLALIGLCEIDLGTRPGWWLFWVGFAIAAMTKGAAAVVLPLTAILFAAMQRWRTGRFTRACWLGLALFLALVLPWHLAMFHLYGGRFLEEYFGLHVLIRATEQMEGHATHGWYYLKVLLVSAPPFVLLYLIALMHAFRPTRTNPLVVPPAAPQRVGEPCIYNLRVFAVFAIVVVVLFSLVQTRLPHYIAPAYPALAVVTAAYLADRLRPLLASARPRRFWIRLALPTAAIWAGSIVMTAPARKSLHSATLADGATLPDNKESIALLRNAFSGPQSGLATQDAGQDAGPLLLWREGRISSIATDVFYSRHQVQQVTLRPLPSASQVDRYTFNPEPLAEAVGDRPSLILLDKTLVPQIPAAFVYKPIHSGQTVELGTIARLR
jgi:4-amino-4-deoxy-L-arabinose transferase-like glycosyltransferase